LIYVVLRRSPDPGYMGEHDCAMCDVPFEVDAVYADCYPEGTEASSPLCPSCLEHLGRQNPKKFPTMAEFEEAKRLYPEPIYTYEPEDHLWLQAAEVSYISRQDFSLTTFTF
jgi:hypothetical protein